MFKFFFLLLISFISYRRKEMLLGGSYIADCDRSWDFNDFDKFIVQSLNLVNISEPKLLVHIKRTIDRVYGTMIFKGKYLGLNYYFSIEYSWRSKFTIKKYTMTLNKGDILGLLKDIDADDYLSCIIDKY